MLFVSSFGSVCISSIGFGGGVVAIVHPIHAPMARTPTNATSTGIATNQRRMASSVGQKSAPMYATAMVTQAAAITAPIAWSLLVIVLSPPRKISNSISFVEDR